MQDALILEHVSVRYQDASFDSLSDLSCHIPSGSVTALIGPNGSGKSTLIRAILGLIPFRGTIHGVDRASIAYVPQRPTFDPHIPLTVFEFLRLTSQSSEMISRALHTVQLDEKIHMPLRELSGGQLQRVIFARALSTNPKFLILDEPEAGIDAGFEKKLYEIIASLAKKGTTILLATHEIDRIAAIADRVICLNKKLLCQGTPAETLHPETFLKMYGHKTVPYGHHHTHES